MMMWPRSIRNQFNFGNPEPREALQELLSKAGIE